MEYVLAPNAITENISIVKQAGVQSKSHQYQLFITIRSI